MKVNVPNLDRHLFRAGLVTYAAFIVFSLLTLWANSSMGMIFSWLTLKYVGLLVLGLLPIALSSGQRTYMFVFVGLLAVLTWADNLTYSRDSVRELGNMKERVMGEKMKAMQRDFNHEDERLNVQRLEKLIAAIDGDQRIKDYDKATYESTKKKFDEELVKAKKDLDEAQKKAKLSDVQDMAELDWAGDRYKSEDTSENNCRDLVSGKNFEFFILVGAFLMLVGVLVSGTTIPRPTSPTYPTYSTPPPAPPAPPPA